MLDPYCNCNLLTNHATKLIPSVMCYGCESKTDTVLKTGNIESCHFKDLLFLAIQIVMLFRAARYSIE